MLRRLEVIVILAFFICQLCYVEWRLLEFKSNSAEMEASLREALDDCGKEIFAIEKFMAGPEKDKLIEVKVTAYTTAADETDSSPDRTALMTVPVVGRTVSVSRDLAPLCLGKMIYVHGFGVRKVEDLTNGRLSNTVDLLVGSKDEAFKVGTKSSFIIVLE